MILLARFYTVILCLYNSVLHLNTALFSLVYMVMLITWLTCSNILNELSSTAEVIKQTDLMQTFDKSKILYWCVITTKKKHTSGHLDICQNIMAHNRHLSKCNGSQSWSHFVTFMLHSRKTESLESENIGIRGSLSAKWLICHMSIPSLLKTLCFETCRSNLILIIWL